MTISHSFCMMEFIRLLLHASPMKCLLIVLLSFAGWPTSALGNATAGRANNVSAFVYNDYNRNNTHNLNEEGMVNVTVQLVKGSSVIASRSTNMWGFANFSKLLGHEHATINSEGEYSFVVVPPEGWIVEEDQRIQSIDFETDVYEDSRLVGSSLPVPVGIRRALYISGTLPPGLTDIGDPGWFVGTARNISNSEAPIEKISLDSSGRFSVSVGPGQWDLSFFNESRINASTRVRVEDVPVHLSSERLLRSRHVGEMPGFTIDFETVSSRPVAKMPIINGIRWDNLVVIENDQYGGEGYVNNTRGGRHVSYNSSGYPVILSGSCKFSFIGAYFGVAWEGGENEVLEVRAWRNGSLVSHDLVRLSSFGPVWYDAQLHNVSKVEFRTRSYWQFVMDSPRMGPLNKNCSNDGSDGAVGPLG